MHNFDFDEWAELQRVSPVAFEQRRTEVLRHAIAESSLSDDAKRRLNELLIDAAPCKDPLEAARNAQKLMLGALVSLNNELQKVHISNNQDGSVSIRPTSITLFTV